MRSATRRDSRETIRTLSARGGDCYALIASTASLSATSPRWLAPRTPTGAFACGSAYTKRACLSHAAASAGVRLHQPRASPGSYRTWLSTSVRASSADAERRCRNPRARPGAESPTSLCSQCFYNPPTVHRTDDHCRAAVAIRRERCAPHTRVRHPEGVIISRATPRVHCRPNWRRLLRRPFRTPNADG
jgi:hypothetical protein